jgi:hypothetical protein
LFDVAAIDRRSDPGDDHRLRVGHCVGGSGKRKTAAAKNGPTEGG